MRKRAFRIDLLIVSLLIGFSAFSQVIPFGFFKKKISQITSLVYEFLGASSISSGGFTTSSVAVPGNKDGTLATGAAVAIDSTNGFFYALDPSNYRVQKFVLSTGVFVGAIGNSKAVGTCSAGKQSFWCTGGEFQGGVGDGFVAGASALAIDPTNNAMYVAIYTSGAIQKFNLSTGAFIGAIGKSTLSGTCSAGAQNSWCTGGNFSTGSGDGNFDSITSIALDAANDLFYVFSSNNHRIDKVVISSGAFIGHVGRKTSAAGTCVAGAQTSWCTGGGVFNYTNNIGGFGSSGRLALDVANDRIYIFDDFYRVMKFVLSTGVFIGSIGYATVASGNCALGVQTAGWCTGSLFANRGNEGAFSSASMGLALDITNDLLYITQYNSRSNVQKFVLSTGVFVGQIGYSAASSGSCVVGVQNGWCSGGGTNVGDSTSVSGGFDMPMGLAISVSGNVLLISEYSNSRIQKFNLSTGAFIGGIGGTLVPISGWNHTASIGKAIIASSEGSFSGVKNIVVDITNDRLYVSEAFRIKKMVLSTGAFLGAIGNSTLAGTCSAGAQSTWCSGGTFSTGTGDGMFGSSFRIVADVPNNRLYSLEPNRIQKFTLSTGAFIGAIGKSTLAGTCVAGAQSGWCTGGTFSTGANDGMLNASNGNIVLNAANDFMYVTDSGNNRIQKFTLSTGAFVGAIGKSTLAGTCITGAQTGWCTGGTFSSGTLDGQFSSPGAMAIDTASDLLYASGSYNIQKFTLSSGAFVGAIGKSTLAGTCIAGAQSGWCTGGTFSYGLLDGEFSGVSSLTLDKTTNRLFASTYDYKIAKFNLTTGIFQGSIGQSTASGTCLSGAQTDWCTGGVFSTGDTDGMFTFINEIQYINSKLYVVESGKIQRFSPQ